VNRTYTTFCPPKADRRHDKMSKMLYKKIILKTKMKIGIFDSGLDPFIINFLLIEKIARN